MAATSSVDNGETVHQQPAAKKKTPWRWHSGEARHLIPGLNRPLQKPTEYVTWRQNEVAWPLIMGPLFLFFALWIWPVPRSGNPSWALALISVAGSGDLLIFAAFLAINLASRYRSIEDSRKLRNSVFDGEVRSSTIQWRGVLLLVVYMIARMLVERAVLPNPNHAKTLVAGGSFIILLFTLLWVNKLVFRLHLSDASRRLDDNLRAVHYVQQ